MQYYFNPKTYRLDGRPVPVEDYIVKFGEKYNHLEVISNPFWLQRIKLAKRKYIQVYQFANCKCNCGEEVTYKAYDIKSGRVKSCSCVGRAAFTKKLQKGTFAENGIKKCSKCLNILSIECFRISKKSRDNLNCQCKTCEYFSKIKGLFNIDISNIDESNLECEICNKKLYFPNNSSSVKDVVYMDHNHQTGEARGFLCGKCNSALGFLNEDINIVDNMIEYIKKHQS